MAGTMQEALKDLAKKNPEFGKSLDAAIENVEAAKEQQEQAELLTGPLELARKAREDEVKRRHEEKQRMSNNLPFGFLYRPEGKYSMVYMVILAPDINVAGNRARMYLEEIQKKRPDDEWWSDIENVFYSLKQLDLSSGMCQVGHYIEG